MIVTSSAPTRRADRAQSIAVSPAPTTPTRYERIYVWQVPIRIFHWVNAAAIAVLFTTGLYIAHPVLTGLGEPYEVFVMARFRHPLGEDGLAGSPLEDSSQDRSRLAFVTLTDE